jgi:hypothetical protein
MTQDEIIEITNKASKEWLKELPSPEETANLVPKRFLEIFAELVHTRGYMDGWSDSDEANTSVSFEMITNAVEAEREACAKAVEAEAHMFATIAAAKSLAAAIRARGTSMNEALKQMVEALETYGVKHRKTYLLEGAWDEEITKGDAAIKAGKQAIAELESQEPVAQPASEEDMRIYRAIADNYRKELTHPPQRTWVGLTDEEIIDVIHPLVMADMPDVATDYEIAKAIEAKLKELNT